VAAVDPGPVDPDKPVEVPAVAPEALEALRREQESKKPKSEADPLIPLALEAGVSAVIAEKVLKRIQRFDPIGCAARDLRECLLIQARHYTTEGEGKDDPDAELLPSIIRKHLKAVESKKYQAIARDLGGLAGRGGRGHQAALPPRPKPGGTIPARSPSTSRPTSTSTRSATSTSRC